MCTVSFVPLANKDFLLIHNRDESPNRPSLGPQIETIEGVEILCPTDQLAGGTWIGASSLQRAACIMNGGFSPYNPKTVFAKSRGAIVKGVLLNQDFEAYLKAFELKLVAPFTLLMVDYSADLTLREIVWDGASLHRLEHPINPKIWSSRQLYGPEVAKIREAWFAGLLKNGLPNYEQLFKFHQSAGEGPKSQHLVMDKVFVKTTSISSFSKKKNTLIFNYQDLQNKAHSQLEL